ncbi:carbohydrate ABC transporter permease [Catellatospora bangladeshensis]|uniref:Sugar ABC transporter permease n=1 Tax=Catellatospora bangladeshensis TaxID=310355 RepID=A0A8J3JVX2_9ACTN|nr:sugar ABC transporter permease [Catellatospora bangladeshensis]GIF84054.1 sugar ABC transporter permease [Catellatospora bangladeshensis]
MASTRSGTARRQYGVAALFTAPFFLLFGVFTLAPIGYGGWLSLHREQTDGLGLGGEPQQVFVGLDNFAQALTNTRFLGGFLTVGVYCAVYIPVMVAVAMVLALLLDSAYARAKRFFQLALYLPNIVPGLIAAMIWLYLYTPGLSPVVDLLDSVGVPFSLGSDAGAVGAVANLAIWEHTGYNVIIFFAALQAIPREVIEAATVDGAGGVRVAWSVKAPMIRGAVVIAVLFTVIGAMQLFTEPFILMDAATTINDSWTPSMYIYTLTRSYNLGGAAAASLILTVVLAAASFVVTRFSRKGATP